MTSEFLIGTLIGFVFGSVVSVISYAITVSMESRMNKRADITKEGGTFGKIFGVRFALDILTLVIVFLLRNVLPFSFEGMLIGAVIGLTVPGRVLLNMHSKKVIDRHKPIAEKLAAERRAREAEEAAQKAAEEAAKVAASEIDIKTDEQK